MNDINDKKEENVVTPIQDRMNFADKTINAYDNLVDTKDYVYEYSAEEVNKYKNSAILCYIPFVSLYHLVSGNYKKSEYLKFHTNEGLVLTILFAIVFVICRILSSVFKRNSLILNDIPMVVEAIIAILYFSCMLYMLFGVINTVNNKSKELPLIGKIRLIKNNSQM